MHHLRPYQGVFYSQLAAEISNHNPHGGPSLDSRMYDYVPLSARQEPVVCRPKAINALTSDVLNKRRVTVEIKSFRGFHLF